MFVFLVGESCTKPVSSIYISGARTLVQKVKLIAQTKNRKGLELTSNSSFDFRHLGKECAEISYYSEISY